MTDERSLSDFCSLRILSEVITVNGDDLQPERLKEITNQMVEAITSPAYVEAMRAVKSVEGQHRLDEAMRRLTPDALKAQGVPLPDDMRISSRYFESGFTPIEAGDVSGQRNVLKEMHEADPGVVDAINRLHKVNPDLFKHVIDLLNPKDPLGAVALCGCACGGAATICGGAGGG